MTGGDLPPCKGSFSNNITGQWPRTIWTDCFGTYTNKSIVHRAGNKYVGHFKDDLRHGQGPYYYEANDEWKGSKYVGNWENGLRHGQGTFTHGNGNTYVGEWWVHRRHGQGTYTWANGDKYVGEWQYGKFNGQGTYTFADIGKIVEGFWVDGCLRDFCVDELRDDYKVHDEWKG